MHDDAVGYELTLAAGETLAVLPGTRMALIGHGASELIAQLLTQPSAALILADTAQPLHAGYSIGAQIADAINGTRRAALDQAIDLLEMAGVPEPHRRVQARPHELTVLDRQRAQLALALANAPALLLAEDPAAGLSQADAQAFASSLARLHARQPFTLLVAAAQRESVERLVDLILILQRGRVSERLRRQSSPSSST